MTTDTSPLSRQPTVLDYSSPTQFRFILGQLPKVEFFTVATNLPGITLSEAVQNTPFKDIPMPGNKLENSLVHLEVQHQTHLLIQEVQVKT